MIFQIIDSSIIVSIDRDIKYGSYMYVDVRCIERGVFIIKRQNIHTSDLTLLPNLKIKNKDIIHIINDAILNFKPHGVTKTLITNVIITLDTINPVFMEDVHYKFDENLKEFAINLNNTSNVDLTLIVSNYELFIDHTYTSSPICDLLDFNLQLVNHLILNCAPYPDLSYPKS